jgi:xylulokinase
MINELRAIGGGARSPLWLQLKADITGIRVVKPQITEAAAWGAAVLGGVGAGIFPSAAEAINRSLKFECSYEPDQPRGDRYNSCYQLYREVYPAVSTIHHRMVGGD